MGLPTTLSHRSLLLPLLFVGMASVGVIVVVVVVIGGFGVIDVARDLISIFSSLDGVL